MASNKEGNLWIIAFGVHGMHHHALHCVCGNESCNAKRSTFRDRDRAYRRFFISRLCKP